MAVRCQHHGFLPIQATWQLCQSVIAWFVSLLVPELWCWRRILPPIQGLKPLSSWMPDLADRIEQLNVWGFVGLFGPCPRDLGLERLFGWNGFVRHMSAGWMESPNTCDFRETSEGYHIALYTLSHYYHIHTYYYLFPQGKYSGGLFKLVPANSTSSFVFQDDPGCVSIFYSTNFDLRLQYYSPISTARCGFFVVFNGKVPQHIQYESAFNGNLPG